jgi:hypothetical protein
VSGVAIPAQPDRDRSRGLRRKGRAVDAIERSAEVDHRLDPQPTQEADLFLLAGASGAEVLAQSLVLNVVPADAHAEAQTPA